MTWLRFDTATPRHPKIRRVARALNIERATALGLIASIWCEVAEARPDGSLVGLDTEDIDDWVDYHGLAQAMIDAELIDCDEAGEPLRIHDWEEYAGGWKEAQRAADYRAKKKVRSSASRDNHVTVHAPSRDNHVTVQLPTDGPTHEPTHAPIHGPNTAPRQDGPSSSPEQPVLDLTLVGADDELFRFPCDGAPREWALTERQVRRWAELYPSLDVESECRQALAWVEASPERKKTAKGMTKFLVNWLNTSQGKPKRTNNAGPAGPRPGSLAETRRLAEEARMRSEGR